MNGILKEYEWQYYDLHLKIIYHDDNSMVEEDFDKFVNIEARKNEYYIVDVHHNSVYFSGYIWHIVYIKYTTKRFFNKKTQQ
jgi:hypothetical protein